MDTTSRSSKSPAPRAAIRLSGKLIFSPPLFLAPMEGVTDRSFRGLVLEQNRGAVGGACTEFLRVSQFPWKEQTLAEELGPPPTGGAVVGVQLMGNEPAVVAETARRAARIGAPFVDLNFGCPAPKVFGHGAGSALLSDPGRLAELVAATVAACPVPVTAKIRAGVDHDRDLEEIATRIEAAGAQMLTVHARLRTDSYRDPADWQRIQRVVECVQIPVVGNGAADNPALIEEMFERSGCAGVMVGRAAIANPWIFAAWQAHRHGQPWQPPSEAEVIAWLRRYGAAMAAGGARPHQVLGRLKQAWKGLRSADLLPQAESFNPLRSQEIESFFAALAETK